MTPGFLSRRRRAMLGVLAALVCSVAVASVVAIGRSRQQRQAASVDSALTRMSQPAPRREPVSLRVQP